MNRAKRRIPLVATAIIALTLAGLGTLAWAWQRDRATTWEVPRWDASRFTRVHGDLHPPAGDLRLVAVNPACPHCLVSLDHAIAARTAEIGRYRLGVLIVDTPRRPPPELYAWRGADETWWDQDGLWRRTWGHRIYGEVLMFDASGRYVGTQPPPRKESR